jgi:hypothetical protein
MESSDDKQESGSIHFLRFPFEIRHRIYQISFEPGAENGRGCANILCLSKFIFAEAQAYLHGPLNANVLTIRSDRHYYTLPFEPPITFGPPRTWRFHRYSCLEASLLPHIILEIQYCDLTVGGDMCMREWLDWKKEFGRRSWLDGDGMPCHSTRDSSTVAIWETNNFDEDIRTARERRPLYDYNLGRQVESFCEMARGSTCLSSVDVYLHCNAPNGLSDAAMKPHFTLPYAPMKKLMKLVQLNATIEIQATAWNGTVGYDGHHVGTGVNETLTVEHFNEMRRHFVEQRRNGDTDVHTG